VKKLILNVPTLAFIAGTRGLLGVGIGLLASQRLPESRRKAVGMTLAVIGAAATVPAVIAILRARTEAERPAIPAVM